MSFGEALKNAGVISEEKLTNFKASLEKEKRDFEKEARKKEKEEEVNVNEKNNQDFLSSFSQEEQECYKEIDRLYQEKRSYLYHLLYSFVPYKRNPFALTDWEQGDYVCPISKQKIADKSSPIDILLKKVQVENLIKENEDILTEEEKKIIEGTYEKKRKSFSVESMGTKSPKSSIILSVRALKMLFVWIELNMVRLDHGFHKNLRKAIIEVNGSIL